MTKFAYSASSDILCIVCAALSVAIGCLLYALVSGWVSL